jgi:hypothetical protein
MKKICCLLAYCCVTAVSAQDYDGVYRGRLLSDNNVLVISTTAGTAVETIYINKAEKITFIGTIADGKLSGSFSHSDKSWSLTGRIKNDSIIMQLISAKENLSTGLKRLSTNTSFKFSKLLNEPPSNDILLIGTWWELYSIKDGIKQPLSSKAKGMTQTFKPGGACQIRSNELDKLYAKSPKSIPVCKWETQGNKLFTTMNGSGNYITIESTYLIKGDTLILTNKNTSSYFLRSGK